MSGLLRDPARALQIERAATAIDGVAEARANPVSGRVLVVLDRSDELLRARVERTIAACSDPEAPPPPSLRRTLDRASRAALDSARALVRAARAQNGGHPAPRDDEAAGPAWHALAADEAARALSVDPTVGLDVAEIERRLAITGPNELAGLSPRSFAEILAAQIFNVPMALLAGAAGLAVLLGDLLEAGAILLVAGSNVVIGCFSEGRAEELLGAWGELRVERARVLRGGREVVVAAASVVPGDVLVLRAGDAIAADARVVVAAADLAADESLLTGESEPVDKVTSAVAPGAPLADRRSMLHAGTTVASGHARAVVTATGQRTALGAVQTALADVGQRAAPLEQQLDRLGRRLAGFSAASAGAVIALGLVRRTPLAALARSAIALAVAAIPEGLPAVGTTALALASRRLFRRGIVIRKLAAAETLGAVSAICADKTGTLTRNRMRVEEIFLPAHGMVRVAWRDDARALDLLPANGEPVDDARVRDLARILALNADVEIDERGEVRRGSGTERALVELAIATGYPVSARRLALRPLREERRSVERSFMVTYHDHPDLGPIELVKGAPEQVVERCEIPGAEGRAEALRKNEEMASRGLRVLAAAIRAEGGRLTLVGLVGLRDPVRPGVREAVDTLARAGIHAYMLTGDQQRTAEAIAAELGIDRGSVYSRVTPEDKVTVVRDLQDRGRIVAMTGDGVNDGPALKAADVGVAMGKRGTDVARAVADVVLASDDLPSLVEAVAEGRTLHDNVRRAIDYLFATNTSEVLVMVAGALLGVAPLAPLQLLWLNMLTDIAPALALALEPADRTVMDRPPRDPAAPLFDAADYRRLARRSATMAGLSLAAYAAGAALGGGARRAHARAGGMAFTALITAQILDTGASRARAAQGHPWLAAATFGSLALQAAALTNPALRRALGVAASPRDLAIAAALGALPAIARERRGIPSLRLSGEIVIERPPRLLVKGEHVS